MNKRLCLSAISALMCLSACSGGGGGGGVNSGGGPVAPTPTPTPTPTPAPTPTPTPNASLLGPLTSESFTNDSASGTATFPTGGAAVTTSAARSSVTVSYDAATRSYSISTDGRSQIFRPSDRDAAQSSSATDVFVRTNGSITDSLTLTRPSATSGALAYKYVGAGYWQRTNNGTSAVTGSFDAFTYGVETPDAALPRTGSANYSLDLLGIAAGWRGLRAISGTGRLEANFASGLIAIRGTAREYDVPTGSLASGAMVFSSETALSSTGNGFNGSFSYNSEYATTYDAYDGTVAGRFYGPGAEEVGATFSARNRDGSSIVGTLTGGRAPVPSLPTLDALSANQQFDIYAYSYHPEYYHGYDFRSTWIRYDAASRSWTFQPQNLTTDRVPSFGPSNRNATLSNARFTIYDVVNDVGTFRLTLYNPGAGNDQLALSYASFGSWEGKFTNTPGLEPSSTGGAMIAFGQTTPTRNIPMTGTATYAGIVFGQGSGDSHRYTVGGTSRFDLAFSTGEFTVALQLNGIEKRLGTAVDFGSFTYAGKGIGREMLATDRANNIGWRGFLAGPNGEEIAGTFRVGGRDPLDSGSTVWLYGATGAKRCAGAC
ncbi:hypothetical protein TPR58_16930 [Sphingomonas sp. HF-S3]|uniref:Transferrin-binding protein B C-lobe/N-lobe beta barrel domain-containing protein n=1 Tax=Sphingomonas rustica TaxID=3103142 RepID=A0ABV0BBB9_9SPHN